MEDQLLEVIEKLKAAKDIAGQARHMRMTAYFLEMAIVEAEDELNQLVPDRMDEPEAEI